VSRCGFALCFCCTAIVEQLGMPLVPVVAMTDYRIGDRMHRLLRGYKDAPTAATREARTAALGALVQLWLVANAESLRVRFASGWDLVTTVPSTCGRVGSPADALAGAVPALAALHRPVLARGPDHLGHLSAARRGFALASGSEYADLRAHRLLVFDDTVVTGARAQSAAAALRGGGIRVVGILVVGRALGAGQTSRARRIRTAPSSRTG
jgi:hypothetical protein